jgi:hypothetical protein
MPHVDFVLFTVGGSIWLILMLLPLVNLKKLMTSFLNRSKNLVADNVVLTSTPLATRIYLAVVTSPHRNFILTNIELLVICVTHGIVFIVDPFADRFVMPRHYSVVFMRLIHVLFVKISFVLPIRWRDVLTTEGDKKSAVAKGSSMLMITLGYGYLIAVLVVQELRMYAFVADLLSVFAGVGFIIAGIVYATRLLRRMSSSVEHDVMHSASPRSGDSALTNDAAMMRGAMRKLQRQVWLMLGSGTLITVAAIVYSALNSISPVICYITYTFVWLMEFIMFIILSRVIFKSPEPEAIKSAVTAMSPKKVKAKVINSNASTVSVKTVNSASNQHNPNPV